MDTKLKAVSEIYTRFLDKYGPESQPELQSLLSNLLENKEKITAADLNLFENKLRSRVKTPALNDSHSATKLKVETRSRTPVQRPSTVICI